MNAPELFDIHRWIDATPQRQREIVDTIRALLPDFEFVSLRTYAGAGQKKLIPIATFRQQKTGVLFNLIPGGSFQMGFSDKEIQSFNSAAVDLLDDDVEVVEMIVRQPEEMRPVHTVTLKPFLIARCPLRLTEANMVLGVSEDSEEAPYSELMEEENKDLAIFYEETISDFLAKSGYLLPSESQWEYACRALSENLFWWGDRIPEGAEWRKDFDDPAETERYSNSFGLVDLGAYPELCADMWHASYENAPNDGTAWTDNPTQAEHVARGGSAFSYPWQGVGEWLTMLSAARCASSISEIGLAVRPVYPLDIL